MTRRKTNTTTIIGILIIASIFGIAVAGYNVIQAGDLGEISEGWEVTTGLEQVKINGVTIDGSTSTDGEIGHLSTLSDWGRKNAYLKLIDGRQDTVLEENRIYVGTSPIKINLGNPVHVTRTATNPEWVPTDDTTAFRTYTKTVDNVAYRWDHHVYLVDLTITTDGQIKDLGAFYTFPETPDFNYLHTTEGGPRAISALDQIYFSFSVDSWDVVVGSTYTEDGKTYRINEAWAGIMSATVYQVDFGRAEDVDSYRYAGEATPTLPKGAPLNMWTDDLDPVDNHDDVADGTADQLGTISGVEQSVIVQAGATMWAGIDFDKDYWGVWYNLDAIQNFVHYRIRFDVLTKAGVSLISGEQPTVTPTPPIYDPKPNDTRPTYDLFGWLGGAVGNWFSAFESLFGSAFGPLVAVAVIFVAIVIVILVIKFSIKGPRR